MSGARRPDVDDVVHAVRAELAGAPVRRSSSGAAAPGAAQQGLDLALALQRSLRSEPLGGRLVAVKRVVHWFVASAFDRQAKVVEALLPAVRSMADEIAGLRAEIAELRARPDAEDPAGPAPGDRDRPAGRP